MKPWIAVAFIAPLIWTLAATAQERTCRSGSADVVRLIGWSAKAAKGVIGKSTKVSLTIENVGAKPFRMIDASVFFVDVLGGVLGGFQLDRDLRLGSGEENVRDYNALMLERLLTANRADIVATVCTKGVVYADGTTARFE